VVYSSSMKATTIKLDGAILQELKAFKEPDQNLTSLVRDLLRAQIHRRKMARAAEEYVAFMSENADESQELDSWASAPLDSDISVRRKKKA
jgi:Arc/MetJ family transcription regulator